MQFRPHIALDVGSQNTRVMADDTIVSIPSVVLRNTTTDAIESVGEAAKTTTTQRRLERVHPIQAGAITDYPAGVALLSFALDTALSWWTLFRPAVIMSKSHLISQAQRRQLQQAVRVSGARSVYFADVTSLAALGAGVQSHDSSGSLVVDVGFQTIEAAIIVRGNAVVRNACRGGGHQMITDIQAHIRDRHNQSITHEEAERALTEVGSAVAKDHTVDSITMELQSGDSITVNTNDIAAAIDQSVTDITELIQDLMRDASAALLSDIGKSAIILTGGVAQLPHLTTRLERRLSVPVAVADNPQTAVVRGAKQAQSYLSLYKQHVKQARNHSL